MLSREALELAARRMTATLARQPRRGKARAYMATLPKRPKVVVSADDYPLIVRPNNDNVLQKIRDEVRYADWVARGKPPSPSAPRRDRLRPRARQGGNPFRIYLYHAQDGNCGLCGNPIGDPCEGTIDHVVPRALGGRNVGNRLLAHGLCNNQKADRPPTMHELEALARVNERLTAQGIEAGTAMTEGHGPKDESPVANGDAPD